MFYWGKFPVRNAEIKAVILIYEGLSGARIPVWEQLYKMNKCLPELTKWQLFILWKSTPFAVFPDKHIIALQLMILDQAKVFVWVIFSLGTGEEHYCWSYHAKIFFREILQVTCRMIPCGKALHRSLQTFALAFSWHTNGQRHRLSPLGLLPLVAHGESCTGKVCLNMFECFI